MLTNYLPEFASILSFSSSQGSCSNSGAMLICDLQEVAAGEAANVTLTIQRRKEGLAICTASVSSTGMDIITENDSASALNLVAPASGHSAVTVLDLPTKDIIGDPLTKVIYASIPSRATGIGNSLIYIDPASGTFSSPILVGADPGKLALSKDSQFLYVGLDGANAVRRVSTLYKMPGPQFFLGRDRSVLQMLVLPDRAESVVIYRGYEGYISIYDDGVKRPIEISGINIMAFSDTTSILYGNNDYYADAPLYRLAMNSSGLLLQDPQPGTQSSSYMTFERGLLYYSLGRVLNPETHTVVGTFSVEPGSLVVPDSASSRVFFLSPRGYSWCLRAFDITSFRPIGTMDVPGVRGEPSSLLRWGTNGLAFRTSADQLFIIRTQLVGPAIQLQKAGADLVLTFATVDGQMYEVERTSNLKIDSWTLPTLIGTGQPIQFRDPGAANQDALFYRVKSP